MKLNSILIIPLISSVFASCIVTKTVHQTDRLILNDDHEVTLAPNDSTILYFVFDEGFMNHKVTITENESVLFSDRIKTSEYGNALSFEIKYAPHAEYYVKIGSKSPEKIIYDRYKNVIYFNIKKHILYIKSSNYRYTYD